MPVYGLTQDLLFPPPELAEEDGLLAVGGDLRPERLLLAYSDGIFPWYNEDSPILWFSPNPRMMLHPSELRVNRSLRKALRKHDYELRFDTHFREVIEACAETPREGQDGTWITSDMLEAYCELFDLGFAHCIEAWQDDRLVGGVYGVSLGRGFFGESMFAHASNASKIAFVALTRQLERWSFCLIDCQVYTPHLAHFGATERPRAEFLQTLKAALRHDTHRGPWQLDADLTHTPYGQTITS
ncbi:MAG TPA: leucyl/phenylalanyl-tRNA--protein transferase [Myxococcales bacterium]|nr:leucyl/phenylalanyl-tRNA--protein transferase [Deltaproteobacteria bacterium]HAA58367.1 leucyl/phenylalanyl-tRNA--protein transferase [Myxococcales bacterium]|tara:strand:+ start:8387 stop:9112 length:726 start_codon:yes stop_codon:yes gene_type:complete